MRKSHLVLSGLSAMKRAIVTLLVGCGEVWLCSAATTNHIVQLPPPVTNGVVSVEMALATRRSIRDFTAEPLTIAEVGQLLWAAQGVTTPDGKRTAPSAGATYPLEVYAVVGHVRGMSNGIYRYVPSRHELVRVTEGDHRAQLAAAALGQEWVRRAPVTVVITGVPERVTSRYGARGNQFMYLEAGHAIENVHLQAVALKLGGVVIGAFRDAEVSSLLKLSSGEVPLCMFSVGHPRR